MNRVKSFYLVCVLLSGCISNDNSAPTLDPTAFENAISQPNVQILDVRTGKEFQSGHLKNAMQADWKNQLEFRDRTLHLSKDKPVLIYCASGTRSSAAAEALAKQGFIVKMLGGGIEAWKAQNKPVELTDNEKPITAAEYRILTNLGPVVLVDIGADWCPPCKTMQPVIERLAREMAGRLKVVRIDAGLQSQLMQQVNAEKIPTFIIYQNGIETWRKEGIVSMNELKRQVD